MKKILLVLSLAGSSLMFGAEADKALRTMIDELDSAIKAVHHNVADIERHLHDLSKDKYRDLLDQSMEKKLNDLKRQVDVLRAMELAAFKPSDMPHGTGVRSTDADETDMISKGIEAEIEAEVSRIVTERRITPMGQIIARPAIRREVIAERSKAIAEAKASAEKASDKDEDHYGAGSRASDEDDMSSVMVAGNLSGIKNILQSDEWSELKAESVNVRTMATHKLAGSLYRSGGRAHKTFAEKKYAAYKKYNIAAYLNNVAVVEFLANQLLDDSNTVHGAAGWFGSGSATTTYTSLSYNYLVDARFEHKLNRVKEFFTEVEHLA